MSTKSLVAFLSLAVCCAASGRAQTLEWIRQFGTSEYEHADGVSADGLGNVYISGGTGGDLDGANAGSGDAFLAKYDESGNIQWTEQLGTSESDSGHGVSADGLGNVYITGRTRGSLWGSNAGNFDAFVSKYDTSGALEWTRQFGTSDWERATDASADGLGNVYISGRAGWGGFVAKYDASGTHLWSRQTDDAELTVSADGLGNVYTFGMAIDLHIAKYDASGTHQWTRELGTSEYDQSGGVSADGLGNVYISGGTFGDLGGTNAGEIDAFLAKYDANGTLQWTRQFGTNGFDVSDDVSVDGLGNVYISGRTYRSLVGGVPSDAFVAKYDEDGMLEWTRQLGTSESAVGRSRVSTDGLGNVYMSSWTEGSLGGPNAGGDDAFVAKFVDLPVLAADFDFDGDVDGDDFLAWQVGFGTSCCTATKRDGDYDNDGDVDGDDFLGWQSEFGAGSGAASAAVPEPASLTLALSMAAVGLVYRRSGFGRRLCACCGL